MEIPREKYDEIMREIEEANSPVGINAKKTHVIIIHKLMEIEKRLARLEGKDEDDDVDVSENTRVNEIIDNKIGIENDDNKIGIENDDNLIVNNNDSELVQIKNVVEIKQTGEITTEGVKKFIDGSEEYFLVDVREPNEVKNYGMIPSANNVPLGEIEGAFSSELNSQQFKEAYGFRKPETSEVVILYCRSGARSDQATDILKRLGYEFARNYRGSVQEWSKIDENVHMYD